MSHSHSLSTFRFVLLRDPCVYCGDFADTIDHIVPRSHGGEDHWMNLAPACYACNGAKKSRSLLEVLVGADWARQRIQAVSPGQRSDMAKREKHAMKKARSRRRDEYARFKVLCASVRPMKRRLFYLCQPPC
jgi:hypothetical protein